MWAIDSVYNVGLIIPGNRYTLAYKFSLTVISPYSSTLIFYVNANTGEVLKIRNDMRHDGIGEVYGYNPQILDTRWKGGFTNKFILHANNGIRDIHSKREPNGVYNNHKNWGAIVGIHEVTSNNDVWYGQSTQTSTHFFATAAWDYFYNTFERAGYDWDGLQCRVRTGWDQDGAWYFKNGNNIPYIAFGRTIINNGSYSLGWDPTIVGHEFTHGVSHYTANFEYEFESGAIEESFSDIFGIVITAVMLDNGTTDWKRGYRIPQIARNRRSLDTPQDAGPNWTGTYNSNGQPVYGTGQSVYYNGENYCINCPYNVNDGGVHINSSIQNHWFYLLANGGSGWNEANEYYEVVGIGLEKAARIAYMNLTAVLMSASQYTDARAGSIWEAMIIYGECSIEHQSTQNAWHAVGLGNPKNCGFTLSSKDINNSQLILYPNPVLDKL